ncbi:MAG: anti-sigma factor family protein [Myxococcaceae bacterium]
MSDPGCPEIEELLSDAAEGRGPALDHAKGCPACAAMVEEHRQLEKDLYRLADPLPPPDFVHLVMARVAAAPTPARSEIKMGAAILVVSLGLCATSFFLGDGGLAPAGVSAARALIDLKDLVTGLVSGLSALWRTAAVPITVAATATMFLSLLGLRRLAGVKVSP